MENDGRPILSKLMDTLLVSIRCTISVVGKKGWRYGEVPVLVSLEVLFGQCRKFVYDYIACNGIWDGTVEEWGLGLNNLILLLRGVYEEPCKW